MKTLRFITITALVLLVSACATTTTRTHPELDRELLNVDSVVVAPPRVEIQYITLTGEDERMEELEEATRTQLVYRAENALRQRGFEIVEFDFERAIAEDEEFAYTVTQIREGFEKAKEDLSLGKPLPEEEAKKIQISVGEAVNIVASRTGADTILLMRYQGFDKSGGHVAKDVGTSLLVGILTLGAFVPIYATKGAVTEAALIDGATGDVLWADIRGGTLDPAIADKILETMPHDVDPAETELR